MHEDLVYFKLFVNIADFSFMIFWTQTVSKPPHILPLCGWFLKVVEIPRKFKHETKKILAQTGFSLHKWRSNVSELEREIESGKTSTSSNVKILGIPWFKDKDKFSISSDSCTKEHGDLTKQKVVSLINLVYDILGITAPILVSRKIMFIELCNMKLQWDDKVPSYIKEKWTT